MKGERETGADLLGLQHPSPSSTILNLSQDGKMLAPHWLAPGSPSFFLTTTLLPPLSANISRLKENQLTIEKEPLTG